VGWARDPFVDLSGETASSPVMDTSVSVSAPEELTVLMTGARAQPSAARDGRRTWRSTEPVARDVGVAAGLFTTETATTADGVAVTAGVLPDSDLPPGELAQHTSAAIAALEAHVGPFPYRTLTVALLPDYGGGIEYPSMIFEATTDPQVLVHEVAHMWFYGMVGNSQFRDPWLDEAFASWAETVVDGAQGLVDPGALRMSGPVGGSMADFPDDGDYFRVVYDNAWSIATPEDVYAALADLPAALPPLIDAQALGKDDVPR
jgi:hypothetical protein